MAGGSADMPDVSFEDDSSYAWVVFRQQAIDGAGETKTRALARRLRGSAFDDPRRSTAALRSAPRPCRASDSTAAARGSRQSRHPAARSHRSSRTTRSPRRAWSAARPRCRRCPSPGSPRTSTAPSPGCSPRRTAGTEARGRLLEDDVGLAQAPPFGPDVPLSDPALGPVDADAGLDADVTRAGATR